MFRREATNALYYLQLIMEILKSIELGLYTGAFFKLIGV